MTKIYKNMWFVIADFEVTWANEFDEIFSKPNGAGIVS
jgi:hypothetical protein